MSKTLDDITFTFNGDEWALPNDTKQAIKDLIEEVLGKYSDYPSHFTASDILYIQRSRLEEL